MARRPQPCGEKLCGDDESGGIRPEVGKEERKGVENKERDVVSSTVFAVAARLASEVVVDVCDGEHKECHEEEPRELDDPTAHDVDQRHGEPVAGHGGAECDQTLRSGHLKHFL